MNNREHNSKKELLFHYTKLDTALFDILPHQKLLLNSVAKMNDIYEVRNSINALIKSNNWFDKLGYNNSFEYLKKNKIKLLSFSQDSDKKRGFDNSLMWSFYGDNYKGVCLVYDKEKLIEDFIRNFSQEYSFPRQIIYRYKKPKDISEEDIKTIEAKTNLDEFRKIAEIKFEGAFDLEEKKAYDLWHVLKLNDRSKDLFFRKGFEWEKENEFRFLIYEKNPEIPLPNFEPKKTYLEYSPDSLIGIILGPDYKTTRNETKLDQFKIHHEKCKIKLFKSEFEDNKIQIIEDPNSNSIRYLNYNSIFR